MWWENLFAAFWILLQFIFWVTVVLIALAILGALTLGLWNALKKAVAPKEPARQTLLDAAEAAAISRYRREREVLPHVEAFTQGADYMWEHLHPKK